MNFNNHSDLEGRHAFLSPSKYHWLNYDDEKLETTFSRYMATQKGTILHDFASQCILLGEKLQGSKRTIAMYVNDAIGYKMTPEVPLYYSENCFGKADAVSFRRNVLRIHDLKTGSTRASMQQPLIYSALFCLEYKVDPNTIETILRLYQENAIEEARPDPEEVIFVMNKIIMADERIEKLKIGE